jgi:hypothetical protein
MSRIWEGGCHGDCLVCLKNNKKMEQKQDTTTDEEAGISRLADARKSMNS